MKRYCLYLFILIGISCSAELKAQKMELFTKGMILPCDIPAERWFPRWFGSFRLGRHLSGNPLYWWKAVSESF